MELVLKRVYHPAGANGTITHNGKSICESIELPWKGNLRGESCIPEGRYGLRLRTSEKYGTHFEVLSVPARLYILIHPANNALTELKGCIAPVLKATSPGKGIFSKKALQRLLDLCKAELLEYKIVYLTIKS